MSISDFFQFLQQYLKNESLPGLEAQLKMVPEPVKDSNPRQMVAGDSAKASGVLILLYPNEKGDPELVLTVRSEHINHSGQISLPGGGSEGDEEIEKTALREAEEEIGIKPDDVIVAGRLSNLYVKHSNNIVTPVVGFLNYIPEFSINPAEVAEVFTIEMDALLDEENFVREDWELRPGSSYKVPFWNVHSVPLWGATAMILSEFMEIYRMFKLQIAKNE